jgi:hypothetical protein
MRTRLLSIAGMAFMASVAVALGIAKEMPVMERVVPRRQLPERVAIHDFAVARDGTVSGTLCSVSNEPVRDVRSSTAPG